MIGSVSASRRANAFAQALEDSRSEGVPGDPHEHGSSRRHDGTTDDTERKRLLALASRLESRPRPELDPEVKTVHRAQLIAAMESALADRRVGDPEVPEQRAEPDRQIGRPSDPLGPLLKLRPRSRFTKGLAAGGLTFGVAAGALTGVAAASTDALPGDSLYGLKRGMESIKLGLAHGDLERGRVYLNQASTRLQEVHRLLERQPAGELDAESLEEIRRALTGMRHDAAEGHRLLSHAHHQDGSLGPIESLSSFTSSHRRDWGELRDQLPPQLSQVGDEVNSIFEAIDSQVDPVRSQLPSALGTKNAQGPAAPSGRPGTGGEEHAGSGSDAPPEKHDPSGSGASASDEESPRAEGLLGNGPGLLQPPSSSSGEPPGSPDAPEQSAAPDITIPPLIPDLLRGLDLRHRDAP